MNKFELHISKDSVYSGGRSIVLSKDKEIYLIRIDKYRELSGAVVEVSFQEYYHRNSFIKIYDE